MFPLPRFGTLYCWATPCSDRGTICNVHCFHFPTSAGFNVGWRLATVPPPRLGKVVVRNKCGFTCPVPELTRIDFSQSANSLIVSLRQSCHSLTLPVSHSLSLPLSQSLSLPVWQALILSLCHSLNLRVSDVVWQLAIVPPPRLWQLASLRYLK